MLNTIRKSIGSSLSLSEKVFILAEWLKKKMHQVNYLKPRPKTCHFLIEIKLLLYIRGQLNNGSYSYWVEEDGKKNKG